VTQDYVAATEVGQHRRADFTCEGSVRLVINILRTPAYRAATQHLGDRRQVDKGWTGRSFDLSIPSRKHGRKAARESLSQLTGSGEVEIHFPVADDEFGARHGQLFPNQFR
jgi:hypothetical protein